MYIRMEWSGFLLYGLVTVRMDGWKWVHNDGIRFIKHLLIQLCVILCMDRSSLLFDGLLTVCMDGLTELDTLEPRKHMKIAAD